MSGINKYGWEVKRLGEIIEPKSKIKRASKEFEEDEVILYIDISSIDNSVNEITSISKYVFKDAPSRAQQVVKYGDILVSLVRPNLNNIAIVKTEGVECVASSGFCVLRPRNINLNFLFSIVKSSCFREYLMRKTSGANYPAVREDDIKSYEILIPPLSTQSAIVAELDTLHKLKELQEQQLEEYDKLAQSTFYAMFGDPIDNEKGWEVKRLGKLVEPKQNIKRASKKINKDDIIFYIDISSIDNSVNKIVSHSEFIFEDAPSRAQQIVSLGDILISLVRPNLNNVAMVIEEREYVASSGFCVLRPQDINLFFLFSIVKGSGFREYLTSLTSGANYPAVREEDIRSFNIISPPISLQNEFAQRIEKIEVQKELVKKSISETEQLINYTMDKYFG